MIATVMENQDGEGTSYKNNLFLVKIPDGCNFRNLNNCFDIHSFTLEDNLSVENICLERFYKVSESGIRFTTFGLRRYINLGNEHRIYFPKSFIDDLLFLFATGAIIVKLESINSEMITPGDFSMNLNDIINRLKDHTSIREKQFPTLIVFGFHPIKQITFPNNLVPLYNGTFRGKYLKVGFHIINEPSCKWIICWIFHNDIQRSGWPNDESKGV